MSEERVKYVFEGDVNPLASSVNKAIGLLDAYAKKLDKIGSTSSSTSGLTNLEALSRVVQDVTTRFDQSGKAAKTAMTAYSSDLKAVGEASKQAFGTSSIGILARVAQDTSSKFKELGTAIQTATSEKSCPEYRATA